tara:strand:+ start:6813 stop:7661 length:849 start_codon:yes stop_codon:yes gene_type:complete
MQKLACFIFIVAVISKILQNIFFRSGFINYEESNIIHERILVISVHNYKDEWENKVRQILNTSVYKENITVCVVILCDKKSKPVSVPIDLQHRAFVTYISNKTKNFISKSIEKVYNNEDYICIFRKCTPYTNWDVNCLEFVKNKVILTASPSLDENPTFPAIKNNRGVLENGGLKKFHSMKTKITPCTCICHNFIFSNSKNIFDVDFSNSIIEESINSSKKIMTPCFPIVKGKYIPPENFYDTKKQYYKNMSIGLSRYPLDNECIIKYGSVESANLQIEFSK